MRKEEDIFDTQYFSALSVTHLRIFMNANSEGMRFFT